MKFVATRLLAIFLLTVVSNSPVIANYSAGADECCRTCCYECSCNPLYCGAFDVEVQVGAAPILWKDRGNISAIECPITAGAPSPLVTLFETPKFSKLYKTPWIIGGQVGYAVSDNVRFYLEVNYLQARRKNNVLLSTVGVTPVTSISFDSQKYRLIDAYLGARYYWDRWCDRVSFFLGIKAGLTHRKRVHFNTLITPPVSPAVAAVAFNNLTLFNRKTVPSGGINFGLDFCFCGCWSLVITGELVASCGPDANENIAFGQPSACAMLAPQPVLPALPNINNLLFSHIGTELRFPVTVGVRYSF